MSTSSAVFQKHARGIAVRRPDEAYLSELCSKDPFVLSLVPQDPSWDVPHRLMAGVQWLILGGEVADYRTEPDPWLAFLDILHTHQEWVKDFVRAQPIQTNEVQRCFALLPLFLTVARTVGKPLDLLELGTSAGLNLLWDCYRYHYKEGLWGARQAEVVLRGEEKTTVPGELLKQQVTVSRRRGVDLNPVDATTDDGFRLLESFVGTDATRIQRMRMAAAVAGQERPELIQGDYVEMLPGLLTSRDDDSILTVFQTLSTIYIPVEQRLRVREAIDQAGKEGLLAWISTPTPEEHGQRESDYPLELAIWPPGERRIVARMDNPGERLAWIG